MGDGCCAAACGGADLPGVAAEDVSYLPITQPLAKATADTAFKPLFSFPAFMCCIAPIPVVLVVVGVVFKRYEIVWATVGVVGAQLLSLVIMWLFRYRVQRWSLQRPRNWLVRYFLPPVMYLDSARLGDALTAALVQRSWGNTFCGSGQVWFCSYKHVAAALNSPQARTYSLGEHPLLARNLPDVGRSRCVFLLALSDKAAGGAGDHEAFRCCLEETIFNEASRARETDEVATKLLNAMADDYMRDPEHRKDFWAEDKSGNFGFWIRYLNYVLLGINPDDEAAQKILRAFLGNGPRLLHYLDPTGYIMRGHALIDKVTALYEASPALASFQEGNPKYHNMTRREVAAGVVATLRIAGVQGAQMLTYVVIGGSAHGFIPVDTRHYWDSLDLKDEAKLRRYVLECARLSAPVTVSHHIATEAFSCDVGGVKCSFPKGTNIAVPIGLAMVDKEQWGWDAWQFNPERANLEECFLGFNSVGGKHQGRECPGKDLVMRTMVRMLQVVGNQRCPARKDPPGPYPVVRSLPVRQWWKF